MNKELLQFRKIGTVYTPFKNTSNMPIQPRFAAGIRGKIVIKPKFVGGLRDLDGFSHIYLISFLHRVKGYKLTVRPPLDKKPHGVFASRSPHRPNPIGLSVVKLISIEDNILTIENVDLLDGTPVLDIKPYSPTFILDETIRTGWIESTKSSN